MIGPIDAGAVMPASVLQAMMTGLATNVSTAACVAAAAPALSSVTVPAADAAPSCALQSVVNEGEVQNNTSVCERRNEGAEVEAELPTGCLHSSTISIKPEL